MAKSLKIPKKIAGVKVPRRLRKAGTSLLGFLDTPLAREMAAAGLTAMAGVLAGGSRTVRESVGDAGKAVAQTGAKATDAVGSVAEAAVGAMAEAARDLVAPALSGKDQGQGEKRGAGKAH